MVTHVGGLHGLEPLRIAYAFRHYIFKVESKVSPVVEQRSCKYAWDENEPDAGRYPESNDKSDYKELEVRHHIDYNSVSLIYENMVMHMFWKDVFQYSWVYLFVVFQI